MSATLTAEDRRAVQKDLFLIEAALATDGRVLSHDNAMRRILRAMTSDVAVLKDVHWVSPEHDGCIEWLEAGAPTNRLFQLVSRI